VDLGLAGKRALVTGASRGLGLAVARALAAEGCRVALVARGAEALAAAARDIRRDFGGEAVPLAGDVSCADDVSRILQGTLQAFAGLDILVTNSGGPPPGTFLDFDDQAWYRAFDLLVMSVVRLARGVLPHMIQAGGGTLLALTSVSVKQPLPDLLLSNSLRLAVVGLIRTLADEVGPHGIRVNALLPGFTATERLRQLFAARAAASGQSPEEVARRTAEQVPLRRLGEPAEVAAAAAFLCSPRAGYIHGACLAVDGGFLRPML
jgi:3-oxoacyl-[acyl-carrier protein] reductase